MLRSFLLLVLASPAMAAAPKVVDVTGFDALETAGVVDVHAKVGTTWSASLDCDPSLADKVEVTVVGSALTVSVEDSDVDMGVAMDAVPGMGSVPGMSKTSGRTRVSTGNVRCALEVQAPSWTSIQTTGTGDVRVSGPLTALTTVATQGTGAVTVTGIQVASLEVSAEGTGRVQLAGTAGSVQIEASGTGPIDAHALVASTVEVEKSGTGELSIHATEQASIEASGMGSVDVYGGGKIQKDISGTTRVRRK